jgi:hypothetical protein
LEEEEVVVVEEVVVEDNELEIFINRLKIK